MKNIFCSFTLCLLFTAFITGSGYSQNEDIKDFFKVGGDLYTAPFHFDKEDWAKTAGVAAGAVGAYFLDKPVKSLFLRNKNSVFDFISEIDKYFYIEGVTLATTGIYVYGLAAKDDNTRRLGLRLAESAFYASTIQILTKFIVGRKRPNADCGPFSFDVFTLDIENSSMPSAHSTLAFAFSTVMADYKDNIAWKITWYTLSSLTALARVYHNMHWFSDILVGSALGYFVGQFVISHETNIKEDIPVPGVPPPEIVSFRIAF